MRPYGMRGLAVLALITGVAFATSPLSDEVSKVVWNFVPSLSGGQYASAEIAAGGEIARDPAEVEGERSARCSLRARPDRVAYGGATILEWHTVGAESAAIGGVGDVPLQGTRIVNGLTASETFILSLQGVDGGARCGARVEVLDPLEKPSCVISLNPSVAAQGDTVLLSWGSEGSGAAFLTEFDRVEARGGRSLIADRSREFVLTVFSPLGQMQSCAASLTVI